MKELFDSGFDGLIIVAVGLALSLVIAYPLMLLWNWLVPAIFGLKTITFLEALGLYLLCGILFKNPSSSK
jgi:predicted benzoate:H+ symporter BenE